MKGDFILTILRRIFLNTYFVGFLTSSGCARDPLAVENIIPGGGKPMQQYHSGGWIGVVFVMGHRSVRYRLQELTYIGTI